VSIEEAPRIYEHLYADSMKHRKQKGVWFAAWARYPTLEQQARQRAGRCRARTGL